MGHCEYPDHLATWAELRRLFSTEAQQQLAFGEPPSILTDLQRSIVAASKPFEELFDVEADPHEEHNLAGLPEYADEQERLSDALDSWLAKVGDLGRLPERELLAEWSPDGKRPRTAEPEIEIRDGLVTVTCSTDGAIVGWTADPLQDINQTSPAFNGYADDGRHWHLYTAPFTPPGPIWVKSWRLGYTASTDVQIAEHTAR
jgi:N-sulfoglucosamine sulfohydrolase